MRTVVRWGLLAVMAPCPLQILAAQERTTVGGYGEVHYTNPTGPKTPPVVNLARFVVYLAHSFDDRLAFRSELEVRTRRSREGRRVGRSRWSRPTSITVWGTGSLCARGSCCRRSGSSMRPTSRRPSTAWSAPDSITT